MSSLLVNYNGDMVNFFRHNDFREILRELVRERKRQDPGFNFSALAKVLGVQKTYLSKVMNEKAYLSTDQLFSLTEFFLLSKEQSDYLILLIEHERTGLAKRKKILQKRIASIQLEHRNPKKRLAAEFVETGTRDSHADYYLDPFMTIVHMYLGLPEFGGDPKAIARSLGLTDRYAGRIVSTLEKLGLVAQGKSPGALRVVKDHLQLAPESPLNSAYLSLFRLVSAQQLMKTTRDQRFAFSVTFSADEKTKGIIHEAFLKFLREIEPVVKEAPAHEVYQMNFDLFPWR